MSPLKRSTNVAARMGRWSAGHWKTAVFGWLAFVVAAFAIGNVVGTTYLDDDDTNVGEARKADKIIEAGFAAKTDEQGEIVLIQSKTLSATDPAFKAAIADVTRTLDGFPKATQDRLAARGGSRRPDLRQRSRSDGAVHAEGHVRGGLHLHRHDQRRPRQGRGAAHGIDLEHIGSVTTMKATDAAFNSMLAKVVDDRAAADARRSCCSCSARRSPRRSRCCSRSPRSSPPSVSSPFRARSSRWTSRSPRSSC